MATETLGYEWFFWDIFSATPPEVPVRFDKTEWTESGQWVKVDMPIPDETLTLGNGIETPYQPVTPLGKRLMALRARAIQKGMRLWSDEEIIEEVKRRRG